MDRINQNRFLHGLHSKVDREGYCDNIPDRI